METILNGNTVEKNLTDRDDVQSYQTTLTGKTVSMVKVMVNGAINVEFEDGTLWEIGLNMVCRMNTKVTILRQAQ